MQITDTKNLEFLNQIDELIENKLAKVSAGKTNKYITNGEVMGLMLAREIFEEINS